MTGIFQSTSETVSDATPRTMAARAPFAAVRGLVGQHGIHLAVGQACLVEAHVPAYVFREQHVILGVVELVPAAVTAYLLLVLLAQGLAVEPVAFGKRGDVDRGGLNLPLLKKRRTLR